MSIRALFVCIAFAFIRGEQIGGSIQFTRFCRNELAIYSTQEDFEIDACARCYNYIPRVFFKEKFRYIGNGLLLNTSNNETFLANETSLISETFTSASLTFKWQQCCRDAILCCDQFLRHSLPVTEPRSKSIMQTCPRTWDGWTCWSSEVHPGSEVRQLCPDHIYWHQVIPSCRGYVTKKCNEDGEWFQVDGKEWSNYSRCARDDIYINRIHFSLFTHCVTIVFLIPALIIFNYYRQLSSIARIRVHKHFFSSLLSHALVSCLLKWYILKASTKEQSIAMTSFCWLLSVCQRYFRSITYLWMFNEALYLHQLIRHAFSQPPLCPLIISAYSLPLITTGLYIFMRHFFGIQKSGALRYSLSELGADGETTVIEDLDNTDISLTNDDCWLLPSRVQWHEWIINVPNLAVLIVNCVFLVSLLKVLSKKASSSSSRAPSDRNEANLTQSTTLIVIRAAVLLLPLYGLHYIFIVYRPNISICWLSQMYNYLSLTLDGLQGTVVSLIFCYANSEIRHLLNRSFQRVNSRKKSTTIFLTDIIPTQQH